MPVPIVSLRQTMEEARQPVRDDELHRAVVQGIGAYANASVRQMGWRNVLIGAGLLLVTLLVAAGGGYWWGRNAYVQTPAALDVALTGPDAATWVSLMRLNDIGKAQRDCSPQAGGVACSFAFWVKQPTTPRQ